MKAYRISADVCVGLPSPLKNVSKVVWSEGEIDQETINYHLDMIMENCCKQSGISTRNATIVASVSYLGDA